MDTSIRPSDCYPNGQALSTARASLTTGRPAAIEATGPTPIKPTITAAVPTPVASSVEKYCTNFKLNVRKGPDETRSPVLGSLPTNTCLYFDLRLPDNSWIRIATEQQDKTYASFEKGWLRSDYLRPQTFEELEAYVPEEARNGVYCAKELSGVNARASPDTNSTIRGVLTEYQCLYFDGRTQDPTQNHSWLRIASKQDTAEDLKFAHAWVRSDLLFLKDYPNLEYFEYLPIVTPEPTPQG
jgi:hypothetical protein